MQCTSSVSAFDCVLHMMLSPNDYYATKPENWRIEYISGTRKKWIYLETEEEAKKWPLSDMEKFNLRIPIEDQLHKLKQPTTPLEASMNGLRVLRRSQAPNGDFLGSCIDLMLLVPMRVFTFHIVGIEMSEPQRIEHIRYILYCANVSDGGWGMARGEDSNVFGTALNYISLRLLGLQPDHPKMVKARQTLKLLGGALGISMWGRFWLCLLNLYEWSGMNSIPPEIWLLPQWMPIHPSKWFVVMRTFHASMSYLYRVRFKAPLTDLTIAIREELYIQDYDKIDWKSLRNHISKTDENVPISGLMRVVHSILNITLESYPIPIIQRNALNIVYNYIRHDTENTDYTCCMAGSCDLNLLVIAHAEGFNSPSFLEQKDRLDEFLWMTPEGLTVNIAPSIPTWAGAFIGHMFFKAGMSELDENKDAITRLLNLFSEEQITENTKHFPKDYRQMRKGGWAFGTKNESGYILFDVTGEALGAIVRLSHLLKPEDRMPEWRLRMSVDLLLGAQSKDGGFPSYEIDLGSRILELLNPTQEFDGVMCDYSTPETTASVTTGLANFTEKYTYRASDIQRCFKRAADYYHASQLPCGGWGASWGVYFTYGTFFALRALSRINNEDYSNSECVQKACHFLLAQQRDDGGWGESHKGSKTKSYVHAETTMAQTAWTTMALMYAKYPDKVPIQRAVERVMKEQQPDGSWPDEGLTGLGLRTCAMSYPQYRFIFPIWMLGMAHKYLNGEE